MMTVPSIRIRPGNLGDPNLQGDFVLYWMTAFRRLGWNFALQHAASRAEEFNKPLVILEGLRVDYPYASPRFHRFLLEGMHERSRSLEGSHVVHYPFVETGPGEGKGLLEALGRRACCVVADDYPAFFLPEMVRAAGRVLKVPLELVDSNGLLPVRGTQRVFTAAYHFRRFLQKEFLRHFPDLPHPDPLRLGRDRGEPGAVDPIPREVLTRWPRASLRDPLCVPSVLEELPLDPSVPPVPLEGTTAASRKALERFLSRSLGRYAEDRNHPDLDATSGLSPYLHFGLISSHQIFTEVSEWEGWTPLRLSHRTDGAREGWWGMGAGSEAFLDQLVTWRELGFNMASLREDYAAFESLPDWAVGTLLEHQGDPRPAVYGLEEFREARTHDPLWNAAQRQLLREGVIHNYLRMLWGKKILEWSPTPREALAVMIDLNDRFALDGRDPNSYSGIFWCLGRYDRGWPERPVFGKVRSMTSRATRRKVKVEKYLDRFSSEDR